MAINLFSLFGGPTRAAAQTGDELTAHRQRLLAQQLAAGTSRGGVNPLAAARTISEAQTQERSSAAQQRANLMAQARVQEQQDISRLIGGGLSALGSVAGIALGGPAGGQVGGQLGRTLGGAVSPQPGGPSPSPDTPNLGGRLGDPRPIPIPQGMGAQLGDPRQDPLASGAPFPGVLGEISRLFAQERPIISDEEAKEDIQEAHQAIDNFLQSLTPQQFTMLEGPARGERRTGVTTQELSRTPVGRSMVTSDPETGREAIDPGAALSALIATQARLSQRIAQLEGIQVGEPVLERELPIVGGGPIQSASEFVERPTPVQVQVGPARDVRRVQPLPPSVTAAPTQAPGPLESLLPPPTATRVDPNTVNFGHPSIPRRVARMGDEAIRRLLSRVR